MKGLDTNVLVRFFVGDDAYQSRAAAEAINGLDEAAPGYICVAALVELLWVLRSRYKLDRDLLARMVVSLLQSPSFVMERAQAVSEAVQRFDGGRADFADYLIERCCAEAGCSEAWTFDRNAARCAGFTLLAGAHGAH